MCKDNHSVQLLDRFQLSVIKGIRRIFRLRVLWQKADLAIFNIDEK